LDVSLKLCRVCATARTGQMRFWTPAEPLRQRHLGIAKSADRLVIDSQVAKVDAQAGRFSIDQARVVRGRAPP
jgi:hypothetical protein